MEQIRSHTNTEFQVQTTTPMKTIYVKNIGSMQTENDTKQAISDTTGITTDKIDIKIGSTITTFGKRHAFIKIPVRAANMLIQNKKLNVGWETNWIEETNSPRRCTKCLKYGHTINHCKNEAFDKNRCLQCMEMGHRANACQNEPKCLECGGTHRNNSKKCQAYKALTEKKESKEERKRVT